MVFEYIFMTMALFTFYNIFIIPVVLFLMCVIILAATGKTLGVRHMYISLLVKVFKWGSHRLEKHSSENYRLDEDDSQFGREKISSLRSVEEMDEGFKLTDVMYFASSGMQAIIEDEVTSSFKAAELSSWNLLTRTNTHIEFISLRLTMLWFVGFVLRWCILFPFRFILAVCAISLLVFGTLLLGYLPGQKLRKNLYRRLSKTAFRIMTRAFSAVVTFHNKENRAKGGSICVANHTSPIDIVILGTDHVYSMVGQHQKGLFGIIERSCSRTEKHVWFNRSDVSDRQKVLNKLKEHVADKNNLPVLIFPEGTCVNNEHILQFKKGSFEVGVPVYPIAVKYNPMFSDPYWNSDKQNLVSHLARIMSSWALVVDIWYLPPTSIQENETAVQFANRVKAMIAKQGGLVDLNWDGGLKRRPPGQAMKNEIQREYTVKKRLQNGLE